MSQLPEAFLRIPLAHRALHDISRGRPENSKAAIAAALDHGYGIEIDLQPSRDGMAMVFHDYVLDRLTAEQGDLRDRDAAALSCIMLKGGDEGIPTLSEVLAQVDGRVPLLIELKDQHGEMGPSDGVLETAVAKAMKGYKGPAAVMSFNPDMVARLGTLMPEVPRGLVTCAYKSADWPNLDDATRSRLRGIPDYDQVGASFVSHHVADLDRARVAELKSRGADVLSWTIRSPEQEAEARRIAANVTFEGYLAALPA
ncbi:MAG: glycerophosphodiester phosphodiesterase family protein [Pseudomonadota bacterium]